MDAHLPGHITSQERLSESEAFISHISSLPDRVFAFLALLSRNASRNISQLSSLPTQQWLRLIAIVGAYILFRPHLLKIVAWVQGRQLRSGAGASDGEGDEIGPLANGRVVQRVDPRTGEVVKSKVVIPEDSDSEDGGVAGAVTGADWGRKARKRQKRIVRQMLEAEERRLKEEQEADSDKEIEDLLER